MSFLGVTLNSTNQNVSSIPTVRRREVESFEAEQMPPPMCHSSMNKNKKRKCNEEQEPLERVSTANSNSNETETSSLIPNSQDSVLISQCNVVTGARQRKQRKFSVINIFGWIIKQI